MDDFGAGRYAHRRMREAFDADPTLGRGPSCRLRWRVERQVARRAGQRMAAEYARRAATPAIPATPTTYGR